MYILPVTPVSFRKLSFKSTVLFLGNLAFNKDTTDTQKKIKKAASILDVCVNYSRSAGNETQKFLWGGKKGCTHKKKKVSVKLLELNVFQHAESGGVQAEGVACVKMWAAVWKRTSLLQNVLEETGAVSGKVSASIWLRSFTGARREVDIRQSPVQLFLLYLSFTPQTRQQHTWLLSWWVRQDPWMSVWARSLLPTAVGS